MAAERTLGFLLYQALLPTAQFQWTNLEPVERERYEKAAVVVVRESQSRGLKKTFCRQVSILQLLQMSDEKLSKSMFYGDGVPVERCEGSRAALQRRYARGENWIHVDRCNKWDPELGCLGHCVEKERGRSE